MAASGLLVLGAWAALHQKHSREAMDPFDTRGAHATVFVLLVAVLGAVSVGVGVHVGCAQTERAILSEMLGICTVGGVRAETTPGSG